jgi:hypothetical protein
VLRFTISPWPKTNQRHQQERGVIIGGGFAGGAAGGALAGLACGPGAPVCVTVCVLGLWERTSLFEGYFNGYQENRNLQRQKNLTKRQKY